jgi:hypothetical protein
MKYRIWVWAGVIIAGVLLWGCSEDETTPAEPDTTPPRVTTTFPADGDTGVAVDIHLQVAFSEDMTVSTLNSQTIYIIGLSGSTVQANSRTATLIPPHDLEYDHEYTAVVTTAVRDAASNRLQQNYQWTFTTVADTTRPIVFWTQPADGAVDVPNFFIDIRVLMSKAIDPATVTQSTFYLSDGEMGAVETHKDTLIFIPEDTLMTNHTYTATLTTGITDTLGNALAADYVWSFTTVSPSKIMPLAVGNMWEYFVTEIDTFPLPVIHYYDTLVIVSDTVIDGERWYIGNNNIRYVNRPDGLYEKYDNYPDYCAVAWPGALHDSATVYSPLSFPYLLVPVECTNLDTAVTTPAGTFNCQMYEGTLVICSFMVPAAYWRFYSPDLGMVRSDEHFPPCKKTKQRLAELVSYDVHWDK